MVQMWIIITLVYLATASVATPIKDGEHVGGFESRNNKITLFGHKRHPYMALIRITVMENDGPNTDECGGVIIGPDTVLTAAHCLYRKLNPTGTVQVGIVNRYYEENGGQTIPIADYRVHELYRTECKVGKRYCYEVNDIGIVWTEKSFEFGPRVAIASLAKRQKKPVNKEGWIVGWGFNDNDVKPKILQRGLAKVIPNQQCAKFNPDVYITDNVICLKGVNGETRSTFGDSGGPFVIEGVLYGICSFTIYSKHFSKKELIAYTYVPRYSKWIERILTEGPPTKNGNKLKPKRKPQT